MRVGGSLSVAVALLLALESAASNTSGSVCYQSGWNITFEDQFEGDELDSRYWTAIDNMTHGPTEPQVYFADEVTVANGTLILNTRERKTFHNGQIYNFTSGWVEGKGKVFQKYGRFEIRAKLPSPAVGREGFWPTAWPAHWLMPEPSTSEPPNVCWPVGGEIDIMEGFAPRGKDTHDHPDQSSMYLSYHWAKECNKDEWGGDNGKWPLLNDTKTLVDWTEFHTFAIEWNATSLTWFIDGTPHYQRHEGIPPSLFIPKFPFYMILNTALTPWSNATLDTGLPTQHVIDRVTWCQPI